MNKKRLCRCEVKRFNQVVKCDKEVTPSSYWFCKDHVKISKAWADEDVDFGVEWHGSRNSSKKTHSK